MSFVSESSQVRGRDTPSTLCCREVFRPDHGPVSTATYDVEAPDEMAFMAWLAIARAGREVTAVLERDIHAAAGLSLAGYDALVQLSRLSVDGVVRMGDLARALRTPKSSLTRVVGDLESAGLVFRRTALDNRRTVEVELTGRGRERLKAAVPAYLTGVQRHVGQHLSTSEAEVLVTALQRVVTALDDRHGAGQ
jgi:DNA-binding MarR family transcriptional regulator